ncbi:putative Rho-type GTPase-activating protein 4 [Colletotrichum spaethianum]|uniref:Rho-type GTPase-activating protein 4 n=1 Tax=Colletotrichum spaethianum TaxID=700344 RepID=A0AA37PFW5_9PEZI|nr:putative Rho-type GTPase-activating protein 4 [Colletotrichum spaethianum]GKT51563.1 putative Rho-type GTPase-activating protein 4 [Colletotrichum spaethianum]
MALFRSSSGLDAILSRPDDTLWERLRSNPLTTIARYLNNAFPVSFPTRRPEMNTGDGDGSVTVVCISDTHNSQPRLPSGDILIHAGDLTASGTKDELQRALNWIKDKPHRYKIVVAGNHDLCLDENFPTSQKGRVPPEAEADLDEDKKEVEGRGDEPLDWGDIIYLNHTSATLRLPNHHREIRIYGSPCTPQHGNWAFQYPRSLQPDPWADTVPPATDILVTHAPPKGHMDDPRGNWGCEFLLREVWRTRPRLHVFGHVHCGHGREAVAFDALQEAYEDVVLREAVAKESRGLRPWVEGWMALGMCFAAWASVWWNGGRRTKGETVLVNAAVVGGIKDRLVREAIVVRI